MAENEKQIQGTGQKTSAPTQQHQSGETLVHVELLAKSWMEPKGNNTYKRWSQGDKLDVPESLYEKLGDGNHFKPSFRKVEKED